MGAADCRIAEMWLFTTALMRTTSHPGQAIRSLTRLGDPSNSPHHLAPGDLACLARAICLPSLAFPKSLDHSRLPSHHGDHGDSWSKRHTRQRVRLSVAVHPSYCTALAAALRLPSINIVC